MYPTTIVYKSHTVKDKFCTICQEFLDGNGSLVHPYECNCGRYEYDWKEQAYKVVPQKGKL